MKKKTSISDKAIKIINKNRIKPIPKWELVAKNWGLWLAFGICVILLILGFSVSWFGLAENIITPYFWVLITAILVFLAYLIFEKTKRAYRFSRRLVIIFITIIGLVVGGILFKIGLGGHIDRNLESKISFYRQMVPMKMAVWNNPDSGYLSGEIIKIFDINNFEVRDFNKDVWVVNGQNPIIKGRVQMFVGEEIKMIGTKLEKNTFEVDEIRPWGGMDKNMMKEN